MYENRLQIIMVFLLFVSFPLFADSPSWAQSKGPFFGKNFFVPYIPYHNILGVPAHREQSTVLKTYCSMYYTNEFSIGTELIDNDSATSESVEYSQVHFDFENGTLETGMMYAFSENCTFGLSVRMLAYYGGFLDQVLERFHFFWGKVLLQDKYAINCKRHLFPDNAIRIKLITKNGMDYRLSQPAYGFGDIDLWGKVTMFQTDKLALATYGAIKLPTGDVSVLTGSGYPDVACAFLADIKQGRYITYYFQSGVVFPFHDANPMFNGLIAMEYHLTNRISFLIQWNIKTAPFTGYYSNNPDSSSLKTNIYAEPQTNVLLGGFVHFQHFALQWYLEEDPITYAGSDFTVNLMIVHTLSVSPLQ